MKEKEIKTLIKVYDYEELSAEDRELVDAAKAMTRSSYAPYSRFHVGAAIRMDGGEIVTGSNQENAAYPSGTCAERTAAYWASAQYPGVAMKKIAIAAWTRLHKTKANPMKSVSSDCPSVLVGLAARHCSNMRLCTATSR